MRLLIVDDEQQVRDFFEQLARSRGCVDIDCATSSEEALTKVIRKSYDFITLDIRMSGLSGLEILSMGRNMCPHAIIAVVSGYIAEEMTQEVSDCVDLFLHKPVSPETFGDLVDKVQRISSTMAEIRAVSAVPITVR